MSASRLVQFGAVLAAIFLCGFCVDLRVEEQEERECYGSTVGFGYSGTTDFHYQQLRKRYAGCTYIHGNLEITNLHDPKMKYDLTFLKTIRYVSGYVLLGLNTEVEYIPMNSLEVIRGNNTFRIMGDDYSLVVVLTSHPNRSSGLKELHMPKLKEISAGKVLFTRNPYLGYVNTINWTPIMRGRTDAVHFLDHAFDETVADNNDTSICEEGTRWGNSPSLCQEVVVHATCHENCNGRCYGPEEKECCHSSCAVGCVGGTDEDCMICKDYVYDTHCVGFCPAKSYPKSQICVKY